MILISTNFWPESTGIAVYSTDLAEFFSSEGFSVHVLTSLPHYPWWKVPKEYSHFREGTSSRKDTKITRASHFIPGKMNIVSRIRFEYSLWRNLNRMSKEILAKKMEHEVVLAIIPSLASGLVGKVLSRKLRIPFGVIVQDLSGIGAKQSGLRGGSLVSLIVSNIEKFVIRGASNVVVISPQMQSLVNSRIAFRSRTSLINNYQIRELAKCDKTHSKSKFGWSSNDFIVLHTGNMGFKQDLANVVAAADLISSDYSIQIVLVGHGSQEQDLKLLSEGKSNVSMLALVSNEDYSSLLAAADLLLINERATQTEMSLPSKLTSYLYSERPVIAAVPRGGATWKFLDGVAELVEAGDPFALARAIEELSKQPEKLTDLAKRGREFADAHLSPEVGRAKYLEWVQSLIAAR